MEACLAAADAPPIISAHFTTPDGLRLATDLAGDPWKPRLVFVHGGGQSRRSWRGALRRMAGAGFSVVSFDLRGHGESDWAPDGDYSLAAHTRDLVAILRAVPSPPCLIGASLGGRAAMLAAAELGPEMVRALVLVDVTPRLHPAGVDRVRRFLRASVGGFASLDAAAATLELYSEREFRNRLDRLRDSVRTGPDGRVYWRWDPGAAQEAFLDPPQAEERLIAAVARFRGPMLLVRGTLSDLVTDDCVAHFRAARPDAGLAEIVGGGHLMKSQRLDDFCEATLEFLGRLHAGIA
jgi:pimeloyl-ACP methyl ester carboxylesterase